MTDPILYWNEVALEVERRDYTVNGAGDRFDTGDLSPEQGGPTRTSRSLAMVHLAMHEAFARADPAAKLKAYRPLRAAVVPAAPAGLTLPPANSIDLASLTAGAVAGAASVVLKSQWRRQTEFVERASGMQGGPYFDYGLAIGRAVGGEMIKVRETKTASGQFVDGSDKRDDKNFSAMPDHHRPDPFSPDQIRLSLHWGSVTPFFIAAPAAGAPPIHTGYLAPFPPVGSKRYNAALRDVKSKGDKTGTSRTRDETVAGIFWGYDGPRGLGVPPRLYNQIVREFVKQHGSTNTPAENARLFALVNAGMADAAIVAWSAKYCFDLWRPVVGIREHDMGFGSGPGSHSSTGVISPECDPMWAPLGRPGTNKPGDFTKTPDFPAYPSGHATFGAVALKLTAKFFADKMKKPVRKIMNDITFTFVSDEFNGANKDPNGDVRVHHLRVLTLRDAIVENALSRVYLGVHWRFDGLGAVAPDGLEGDIPADPAAGSKLAKATEKMLGGVPIGLKIADDIYAKL